MLFIIPINNKYNPSMLIEKDENLASAYESRIAIYCDSGYRCEYDVFFMKNFYKYFKFMKLSQFVEAMRFLSKVT